MVENKIEKIRKNKIEKIRSKLHGTIFRLSAFCRGTEGISLEELDKEIEHFFELRKAFAREKKPWMRIPDLEWNEMQVTTLNDQRVQLLFERLIRNGYRFNIAELDKFPRFKRIYERISKGAEKKVPKRFPARRR